MLYKNIKDNYENYYEHDFDITNRNRTFDGCDATDRVRMTDSFQQMCVNYVNDKIDQRFI